MDSKNEQTPLEPSTIDTVQKTGMSTVSIVIRVFLFAVLLGSAALAGVDYSARSNWEAARKQFEILVDEDVEDPKEFMDAVGTTPRIRNEGYNVEQYYRWGGFLNVYDIKLTFTTYDGADFSFYESESSSATRFKCTDLSGLKFAQAATGTLDKERKEGGPSEEELKRMKEESKAAEGMAGGGGGGGIPGGGGGGIPGGGGGGGDDRRAQFTKIREAFELEIKAFLSEDQMKKYKDLRAQAQSQRGGGGGSAPGGGGGFQGPNEDGLKMDADTQAKWDAAIDKQNDDMANLPGDRREASAKRRELLAQFRDQVKAILSEEQFATFEKNNPQRRSRGRRGISADQLGLEGEVKIKYEAATEKMSEQVRALFQGGSRGGGIRPENSPPTTDDKAGTPKTPAPEKN